MSSTWWEIRSRGDMAMAAWAMGRDPSPWLIPEMKDPDLEHWNGEHGNERGGAVGSQNGRPPREAVLARASFFLGLTGVWQKYGEWGREWDSPVYLPSQLCAWLIAWQTELRISSGLDLPASSALRHLLRRTWTHLALRALVRPGRAVLEVYLNGDRQHFKPLDYNGPQVALAGDRWNPAALGQQLVGPILAWAIAWPDRHFDEYRPLAELDLPKSPAERRRDGPWWKMLAIIGRVVGADRYEENGDPWRWGLTREEQAILRRIVAGDPIGGVGDLHDARHFLEPMTTIGPMRIWRGYRRVRILRTASAVMTACEGLANRNKPGHPATRLDTAGVYETIRPSRFRGTGATIPEIRWTPAAVEAEADGQSASLAWPEGEVLWDLEVTPKGVVWTVSDEEPDVDAVPHPVVDPELPRQRRRNLLGRILDWLRGLF